MKKISHKLPQDDSSEKDIFVLGLVSSAKDFRISWMINQELGFELAKTGEINITIKEVCDLPKKQTSMFTQEDYEPLLPKDFSLNPVYFFSLELFYTKVFLYVNQGSLKWLVPEMKTMDYFLVFKGPIPSIELKQILKQLKTIPVVTLAVEIDLQQIPQANRDYFIHDYYGTLDKN